MNAITNQMLLVGSNCYYLAVQKKTINIGDWHGSSLATPKSVKTGIQMVLLTHKSIKIVARCQI